MKSRKEMGPSRAIRRRSRSESVTETPLYFSCLKKLEKSSGALLLLSPVLLAAACASHREPPLPTLEDYSDRISIFAEKFLEDWKAGAADPGFYASDFSWSGALPGDELTEVPARPPLRI